MPRPVTPSADEVDAVLDGLTTPDTGEVWDATREFGSRVIAAAAASRAIENAAPPGSLPDPSGEPDGQVLTTESGAAVWAAGGGSPDAIDVTLVGPSPVTAMAVTSVWMQIDDVLTLASPAAYEVVIPDLTTEITFENLQALLSPVGYSVVNSGGGGGTYWQAPYLVSLGLPELIFVGGDFTPTLESLTSLDLSKLKGVSGYFVPTFPELTELDLSALVSVYSFAMIADVLESLDLSALEGVTYFVPMLPELLSLDLSALNTVAADFGPTLTSIGSLDLPLLEVVGGSFGSALDSATSLTVPALRSVGYAFGPTAPSLTSLDLSSLETVAGTFAPTLAALETLDVSGLLSVDGDFSVMGSALDQTSVDGILIRLAALNGTGGTTTYDGHIVDLSGGTSASPSNPAGLAAKAMLEGRLNTVNVN